MKPVGTRAWPALSCLLVAACTPSPPARDAAVPRQARRIVLSEDGNIGPRGRIDHLAYDPASKRLFVACVEAGALAVVSLESADPPRILTGLPEAQGIAVVPGNKAPARVFVACGGDGKVHVFDAVSLAEQAAVPVGEDADNVRWDQRTRRIQVGCGTGERGAIVAIDADTLAVTSRTPLPAHAEGFQLDHDSSRMFVNVPGGKDAGDPGLVVVADRERGTVTATWRLQRAARNFPLAWLPSWHLVLTVCRQPPVLLAIDGADGREVARVPCTADCDDVFFDAASGTVLAIAGGTGQGGGLDAFALQSDGLRLLATLPLPPRTRTGLLVPERRALYVAVPAQSEHGLPAILEFLID